MTLSQEINETVERQMALLPKAAYIKPHMSYDDFVKEYSEALAQAEEDQSILKAAGFDDALLPVYNAYLVKLAVAHGERINSETHRTDAQKTFADGMPTARKHKATLMAMGRYVVARCQGPEAKRVFDLVRKGRGDVDTLNDIVSMVTFARRYKKFVDQVRPGGIVIDEAFLSEVEQHALALLKIRGQASAAADNTSSLVDRQNQLITLCIEARREIKLFAGMAFFKNRDHYNRHYASAANRRHASKSRNSEIVQAEHP